MKIKLTIDFCAVWGQTVFVCGSAPETGKHDESEALEMECVSSSLWAVEFELKNNPTSFEYYYLIKENNSIVRREWGNRHLLNFQGKENFIVHDRWYERPHQEFLYTSGFTDSFFFHEIKPRQTEYYKNTVLLQVQCPYVKKGQTLVLSGSSDELGNWQSQKVLKFIYVGDQEWQLIIDAERISSPLYYKFAILDEKEKKIIHWEDGNNRRLDLPVIKSRQRIVNVINLVYRYQWMNWKASGVAIPVFSLRSEESFGIGEFSDLKKMVDWAAATKQNLIQLLPINDTTITYTWTDSYPYNAISIYALHPIYLGLKQYPLKNETDNTKYLEEAKILNDLKDVDYDKVMALKRAYLCELFKERGEEVLKSADFEMFFNQNEEWLFPYAYFSYLRDENKTADYRLWKEFSVYDKKELQKKLKTDVQAQHNVNKAFFIQYLLHKQLIDVKEYAHKHNVVLKGDIPIGISRNSVEAWVEPFLFNLDTQTGAPPDDFSFNGQNWGFPTYNWDEMAKDDFQWWKKRFRKMTDYFDAYRIDHILGFFRIWEIPESSVQGLLGYFSPALPLSVDEIHNNGLWFDEYRMTMPYIHEHFLGNIFGEYVPDVIKNYLHPISWQRYELNEECNSQVKIRNIFAGKTDNKSILLRDGLYGLCNEVLFIRDKYQTDKFHPRITAQYIHSYKDLDDKDKAAFNRLYDEFFYRRHSNFWRQEAMKKLPSLISSTSMLVCGEDLGMIPNCVPSVMSELQILSLEIERMPKTKDYLFESLNNLPYLSVCTTSTHDMSPIRVWWKENREITQIYYSQVLWKNGVAPSECTPDICWQILTNHLNSPSMLSIFPLQDWLSMDQTLRRPDAEEERINIPAIPQHYWRYRMHLTLEELINASDLNNRIANMVEISGRS
ncbi:MAG: 4-alpha-glucanotransferase [Dysgonomonas sp.]